MWSHECIYTYAGGGGGGGGGGGEVVAGLRQFVHFSCKKIFSFWFEFHRTHDIAYNTGATKAERKS